MPPTEQEVIPPSSRILDTPTALFLLATLIFLYAFLFVWPFTPVGEYGDGILYLNLGKRMYEGELIYRDFFEFLTPGTTLVSFVLYKLFGPCLWIPNLEGLLLGLGLAWLGVVVARKLMRSHLSLLPSAIFLAGLYRSHLDPTHHWYSLLSATGALAVLMERRTPTRILAAGSLCGLTACFTQTRGLAVAVGFGAFLWWESRRRKDAWRTLLKKEAWLVGGFLPVLVAVNGYFVWKAGLRQFLWCTVVFGFKYYSQYKEFNTFMVFGHFLPRFVSPGNFLASLLIWLFLNVVIPSTYILFFIHYWRSPSKQSAEITERPMLLALVGACLFLSVAPAPSPPRLAMTSLPGIILLGWFLNSPHKRAGTLAAALSVGALLVALHAAVRAGTTPMWILTTPQGKVALADPVVYEEYAWVQQHTRPSEHFFQSMYPNSMDVYFYLNLRNPTPLPYVQNNGYTPAQKVPEVIRGLEQHQVHYILWSPELDEIPKWEDPSDDHLGPLRDYMRSRYRVVKVFADSQEVWERRD